MMFVDEETLTEAVKSSHCLGAGIYAEVHSQVQQGKGEGLEVGGKSGWLPIATLHPR